jgi:RNA polymerase sigma-70 factor (ECF subfamily)
MKKELTEPLSDQLSMAEFYEKTAPAILAYARSRLPSQEQAEDLLVEVFVAAFESKKFLSLNSDERFAWLRGVAQHKIIDRYRQTGRQMVVTLEHVEKALSLASDKTPEHIVLQQEELRSLQAALYRLPPLQQQVLFLHFVNGLRCTEIATLLGKRDGAVRVLLSRALNRLREIYATSSEGEN